MSALSGSYIPTLPPHVVREDVLMLGFVYAGRIRTASRVFVASERIGGASVRVRTGRSLSTVVLAQSGEVHSIHTFLDSTEGSSLYGTTGHLFECSTGTQVLEVRTWVESDVHLFDVVRGEFSDGGGRFTAYGNSEGSDFAQLYLFAFEQQFDETFTGIRENTLYGTTAEYPVMVRDVTCEAVERPYLRDLAFGIGFFSQSN